MEAKTSEDHLKVQKMKKKVLRKQVRAQHTLMRHEGIKCISHATQVTGSCDFDGSVKMLLICVLFSCVLCKTLFLKMHFPRLRVFCASLISKQNCTSAVQCLCRDFDGLWIRFL